MSSGAVIDDRYEILDVLGSGGMATVWRARDRVLDRFVAVKRPHPAIEGDGTADRFRREARTAASVVHPNLVVVHDVGTDDAGPYLVMEFVDAPSLDRQPARPDEMRRIGAEIASGLAALHEAGIVHRDVKPANILRAPGGAKLTDFGIARSLADTAALTTEGQTFSTPAYAAPEIHEGRAFTEASDVFALGVVLREGVLGRRVVPDTDTRVMITDPFWRSVIDGALDPDPARRPTADQLAATLGAPGADVGSPVLASGGSGNDATERMPTGPPDATASGSGGASVPAGAAASARPDDRVVTTVVPIADRESTPMERNRNRLLALFGTLAVLSAILVAVAVTGGGEGASDATADPLGTIAPTTPATDAPAAEGPLAGPEASDDPEDEATPPETPPTTVAPEAAAEALQDIDSSISDFGTYVGEIRGGSISEREADRLLDDVDAGVRAVADGDEKEVDKQFESAARRIDKHVKDEGERVRALELLFELMAVLGVEPTERP